MSQKIKRGGKSVRKIAAAQGKARTVRTARARTGSAFDSVMAWMPFSEEQLHRVFLAAILGAAVALAWIVASFAGVPAMAGQQLAVFAADAGFEVKRVEVRGIKHLNELKVYERVLAERDRAMPLVDIDGLREELLQLSWVEDARVSRQLPDTLVIDVVERKPHAVLRKADRLVLIDATGHELETVSAARAKGKLVLSGPGASRQVVALTELLGAAPALKPQVREAEWVGNRRWNLTFKTGQVLALPEGTRPSSTALMSFARLDGINRLLGGKVAAFDMRASDRIYFRVPGRTDPVELPKPKPSESAAPKPKQPDRKPEDN
jgi:cell division protein FtsQ